MCVFLCFLILLEWILWLLFISKYQFLFLLDKIQVKYKKKTTIKLILRAFLTHSSWNRMTSWKWCLKVLNTDRFIKFLPILVKFMYINLSMQIYKVLAYSCKVYVRKFFNGDILWLGRTNDGQHNRSHSLG